MEEVELFRLWLPPKSFPFMFDGFLTPSKGYWPRSRWIQRWWPLGMFSTLSWTTTMVKAGPVAVGPVAAGDVLAVCNGLKHKFCTSCWPQPMMEGLPSADSTMEGKDFFLQARYELTFPQFQQFLLCIKSYNNGLQTKVVSEICRWCFLLMEKSVKNLAALVQEKTLNVAHQIFGRDHQALYMALRIFCWSNLHLHACHCEHPYARHPIEPLVESRWRRNV